MSDIEILVPDVGSDGEVEVIELLVSEGDKLQIDDPVVVLESDKASIEVPATVAGSVVRMVVKTGDKVKQGDLLAVVTGEMAGDNKTEASHQPDQIPATEPSNDAEAHDVETVASGSSKTISVNVPDIGGADSVEVIEVSVSVGQEVEVDDPLIVLESDKASMDIPSPYKGMLTEISVAVGDKVAEGALIAKIQVEELIENQEQIRRQHPEASTPKKEEESSSRETNSIASQPVITSSENTSGLSVHAGPAVRKLARELGVELDRVKPTGPRSRIQKEDLNAYIKQQVKKAQTGGDTGYAFAAPKLPDFEQFGEIEKRRLEKLHLVTARNMQSSWANVPHVTQFDQADITELEAFRQSKKLDAEARQVRLTPVPFLIKAVAKALQELPQFNVSLDLENQQLIQKKYYHIGVAVDTSYGLVVPVIRDVLSKDLWQIADELGQIAEKAKNRKLAPQDMQGACFTISSLGSIGGTAFTPIVNQPEVAILGVSKAQIQSVYNGKKFKPRLMLPLSLSYDHRAVNGADAARFTVLVAKYLSDIRELLF